MCTGDTLVVALLTNSTQWTVGSCPWGCNHKTYISSSSAALAQRSQVSSRGLLSLKAEGNPILPLAIIYVQLWHNISHNISFLLSSNKQAQSRLVWENRKQRGKQKTSFKDIRRHKATSLSSQDFLSLKTKWEPFKLKMAHSRPGSATYEDRVSHTKPGKARWLSG